MSHDVFRRGVLFANASGQPGVCTIRDDSTFCGGLRAQRNSNRQLGIYMLSNESRDLMEYRIPNILLTATVRRVLLVSAFIGLRKPEAEFFQLCARYCLNAGTGSMCLYRRSGGEYGRRGKAGIHGIRLESPEQCYRSAGASGNYGSISRRRETKRKGESIWKSV